MRTPLTRDRIVEAALGIVDEHGLETLSMRKTGAALGVEAMSLYRHVRNKDDLLTALHDHLVAQVETPAPGDWEARIRDLITSFHTAMLRHPRAVPLVGSRPASTPRALAVLEAGVAILTEEGWPDEDAVNAFQTVFCFLVGHLLFHTEGGRHAPEQPWEQDELDAGVEILMAGLRVRRDG